MGLVSGFFTNLVRGRPKANPAAAAFYAIAPQTTEKKAEENSSLPVVPPSKNTRGPYQLYSKELLFELVIAGVEGRPPAFINDEDWINSEAVPRQTIQRYIAEAKQMLQKNGSYDIATMFERKENARTDGLLSKNNLDLVKGIIKARDMRNNGMNRKDVIGLISYLGQVKSVTAENHFDYLIRSGKLADLKKNGRVVLAQKTTTKRGEVTLEQQLRWHTTVDEAYAFLLKKNSGHAHTDFRPIMKHFIGNADEACIMANEGTLRVVSSKAKKKTEKNVDDNRMSVTIVRVGTSEANGPTTFLGKGKKKSASAALIRILKKDAPAGSLLTFNDNAYMTDETWIETSHSMAKGIRALDVVCDYPDWWFVLFLDGYISHLNSEALQIFADHKILIVKEEGDASDTNQAYDRHVAKQDKRVVREVLEATRQQVSIVSQNMLLAAIIKSLSRVDQRVWEKSFIDVNLHPDHRTGFEDWARRIHDKLEASARFLTPNSNILFNSTPAMWKKLTVEERKNCYALIDQFHSLEQPWSRENICQLLIFASYEEMPKLRACYLAGKKNYNAIVIGETPVVDDSTPRPEPLIWNTCKPKSLTEPMRLARESGNQDALVTAGTSLFLHLSNFTAQNLWSQWRLNLVPSVFLQIDISSEQTRNLNPSYQDVLLGKAIHDTMGKGALQKSAARRIDFITGNVSSYSRLLNGPEQLDRLKDHCELTSVIASLFAEEKEAKEAKAAAKKQDEADKGKKKAIRAQQFTDEREKRLPGCP